jgi:hypothetical protein
MTRPKLFSLHDNAAHANTVDIVTYGHCLCNYHRSEATLRCLQAHTRTMSMCTLFRSCAQVRQERVVAFARAHWIGASSAPGHDLGPYLEDLLSLFVHESGMFDVLADQRMAESPVDNTVHGQIGRRSSRHLLTNLTAAV